LSIGRLDIIYGTQQLHLRLNIFIHFITRDTLGKRNYRQINVMSFGSGNLDIRKFMIMFFSSYCSFFVSFRVCTASQGEVRRGYLISDNGPVPACAEGDLQRLATPFGTDGGNTGRIQFELVRPCNILPKSLTQGKTRSLIKVWTLRTSDSPV
jgi:hypothetical protein